MSLCLCGSDGDSRPVPPQTSRHQPSAARPSEAALPGETHTGVSDQLGNRECKISH